MPDFSIEDQLDVRTLAAVDEAGRGPLAGPVVAAAVILERDKLPNGIDDSKCLLPGERETLFSALQDCARIGVGIAEVEEIDELNILGATKQAMIRSIEALNVSVDHILVDGNQLPAPLPCEATAVIGGDSLSFTIAAASIIAKVTRDRIMQALAPEFPHFGWETNMGYATPKHMQAIREHGFCHHHRKSFDPVKTMISQLELAI